MPLDNSLKPTINLLILFSIFLIAILGFLANYRFFELDYQLTTPVLSLVIEPCSISNSRDFLESPIAIFVQSVLYLAVSIIGTICGLNPRGNSRLKLCCLVLIPLIALYFLIVWVGFLIYALPTLLLAFLVAIYSGTLNRKIIEIDKTSLAQHEAIVLKDEELNMSKLKLIKSDEIDRRTLAADLHDQVLHGLKMVRQNFHKYESEKDEQLAIEIDAGLASSMDEIRDVMDSLSPSALENLGFSDAIEEIIRKGATQGNLRVRFRCDVETSKLKEYSKIEQTLLYRIVQESMNNIVKHARASKVRCLISIREDRLHVTLADDGIGFDADNMKANSRGMQYMIQRASIISATIDWRPVEKGTGTVVDISI